VLRKYQLPENFNGRCDQAAYERWLQRKATAHVRRDRKRGNTAATIATYKQAIHDAVARSSGLDEYTGEALDWDKISKYDNEESRRGRRAYKASLALLPTVDHVGDGLGAPDFAICAWRTNDAKNDLSYFDFLALCRRVVAHHDGKPSLRD
jgi:hypothetical protein